MMNSDSQQESQQKEETHTRQLFLAPCSNAHARQHFDKTVLSGVNVETYSDYLPAQFRDEEKLSIWGTGEGNATAAQAMETGDIVAFYVGDKTYSHVSIVRTVERNKELARQIWRDKNGETWPYVIYLEDPMEVELNSVEFHPEFGWNIAYPRGFTRVNDEKVEQMRIRYGSLDNYFQQRRVRMAFEQGEELPIDMYAGPESGDTPEETEPSLRELRETAEDQGSEIVSRMTTSQARYARSESVKKYARKRADGECEGCGGPAPFRNKRGEPYLEVHHVFRVSDEGPDKPNAVIALCPNCHRKVHQGEDGNEFNRQLIEKLNEIEEDLDQRGS